MLAKHKTLSTHFWSGGIIGIGFLLERALGFLLDRAQGFLLACLTSKVFNNAKNLTVCKLTDAYKFEFARGEGKATNI